MLPANYNVPVLFLIYRRPDLTSRVWEEIASIKPAKLYIAADGPKNTSEKAICDETREITENINWNCEVKRLYRDANLGCMRAVSDAITWFFSEEEEGVILEDDCLPNASFFRFCSEMLVYYKEDQTVGHISGSNHHKKSFKPFNSSFYFSKYPHIWGWATWKRVWQEFKPVIKDYPPLQIKFNSFMEKVYWWDKFRNVGKSQTDIWDYQYLYLLWHRNLKAIMPQNNMIKNIGFDSRATHYSILNYRIKRFNARDREEMKEIIFPDSQEICVMADKRLFKRIYNRFFISNLILVLQYFLFQAFKKLPGK